MSRLLDRPLFSRFEVRHAIGAALALAAGIAWLNQVRIERIVEAPAMIRQICERWDVLEFDRDKMDAEDRLAADEIGKICTARHPLPD